MSEYDSQYAKLLWITPNAEQVIEQAGRTAYMSEGHGDPAGFIQMLISRGHESVLEHASASFLLYTDRGITHELVRHRLASYTQTSTRYVDYSRWGLRFVIPDFGDKQSAWDIWRNAMIDAAEYYYDLRGMGIAPQLARSVLPTATAAQIVMTANFREWRHILKLRLAPSAHPQMRGLMLCVARILAAECPAVFDEFLDKGEKEMSVAKVKKQAVKKTPAKKAPAKKAAKKPAKKPAPAKKVAVKKPVAKKKTAAKKK